MILTITETDAGFRFDVFNDAGERSKVYRASHVLGLLEMARLTVAHNLQYSKALPSPEPENTES